jgi:hypothetical protein
MPPNCLPKAATNQLQRIKGGFRYQRTKKPDFEKKAVEGKRFLVRIQNKQQHNTAEPSTNEFFFSQIAKIRLQKTSQKEQPIIGKLTLSENTIS